MVPPVAGDYESLGGKLEGLHDKLVESYVRLVNESLLGRFENPASHSPRATRGRSSHMRDFPSAALPLRSPPCTRAILTFPNSIGFEGTVASLSDCTPNMFIALLVSLPSSPPPQAITNDKCLCNGVGPTACRLVLTTRPPQEEMVGCEIPGINPEAVTVQDHEENMETLLVFLGSEILGAQLDYIRGAAIAPPLLPPPPPPPPYNSHYHLSFATSASF